MDINSRVLHLINSISAGKRTYAQVERDIKLIEKKYGQLDMLYEVEDRMDEDYVKKLIEDAHFGVYSKKSILKIADIYDEKSQSYIRKRNTVIAVVLALLILMSVCIGFEIRS